MTIKMLHLMGCIERLSTGYGKGMCFHRSAAMVLDLKGAEIVMGTFRAATPEEQAKEPNASKVPFIHCWVEHDGAVFSPSTFERRGNRLVAMRPEEYYEVNGAHDFYRLSRTDLIKAASGTGLSSYFKHGTELMGGRTVAEILLSAAGVPFALTEFRSVVPLGSPEAV